jgi:hypothetical protein
VQQFLAKKSIRAINQLSYCPDLTLSDFWLFPTLKMGLKGTGFVTMEDIKWNPTVDLRKVPKETFRHFSKKLQDRWSKCVRACVRARSRKGPTLKMIK